ncbi:MAG TPA: aminoglycoside phosphotransferase family protein [Chloroflexaceae bacterium]|nr:aminoglycoside phosphotransferase family protein [Chloroflexaceae bacterium]
MDYSHLNHYLPPVADGVSDAWRRAMGRLGDYTSLVVRSANLRPEAATLYGQTDQHLLVRLSTPGEHLILRVAPEDDLAAHVFFTRTLSGQQLPSTRILQRDLSRTLVPFAYTLEVFVPGVSAASLREPHLLRGAGRQAGRALRRMHRVSAPGAGRPNPAGRWPQRRWAAVLRQTGATLAPPPADALVFGEAERAAVEALLADPRLNLAQPSLMHGDFGPRAARCTAGLHVHLEALVEPGRCVGGDGLFDLACGLCPIYPEPWREGLLDGYCAAGPLSPAERERLPLLRLLAAYWLACRSYMRAEPHEPARDEALRLLEEVPAA